MKIQRLCSWMAVFVCIVNCILAQQSPRTIERVRDGELTTAYRIERVAGDLRVPWGLVFLPDGRIVFTEREGRVRIIEGGKLIEASALTIAVALGNKMGMLGIVQDPDFVKTCFIYIAYNYRIKPVAVDDTPPVRLRIERYRLDGYKLVDPKVVIEDIPAASNHTGCRLVFGPHDRKLYITTGDADRPLNAQRLDRLNGKILRLNPDGSIPADNPFANVAGARKEIWSYGHRNPQGLVFEPDSNRLVDSEHGPGGGDEINWIEPGKNYGWPVIDHARTQKDMVSPVLDFSPSVAPGEAMFYRGSAFPELRGKLLVACLRGEGLLRIDHTDGKFGDVDRLFRQQFGRIRSITESPEGYLYLTTSQFDPAEGQPRPTYDLVLRIVPAITPPSGYPTLTPPNPVPEAAIPTGTIGVIERSCSSCHGPSLMGGMAPGLLRGNLKYAPDDVAMRKVISLGIIERGMPPHPDLTSAEIDGLIAYIHATTQSRISN